MKDLTKSDIQEYFLQFGAISSIKKKAGSPCAFITFNKLSIDDQATLLGKKVIKGIEITVRRPLKVSVGVLKILGHLQLRNRCTHNSSLCG